MKNVIGSLPAGGQCVSRVQAGVNGFPLSFPHCGEQLSKAFHLEDNLRFCDSQQRM